jgi:hypothetical protein
MKTVKGQSYFGLFPANTIDDDDIEIKDASGEYIRQI